MTLTQSIQFSPVDIKQRQKLDIRPGDTVRVWQRVKEGDKTRLQSFEGFVLARKHGSEPGATFTVRKEIRGIGVERIFPLYSPSIEKIELVRRSKVRRAKLYYIREKAAREARRKMKKMKVMDEVMLETKEEKAEEKKGEEVEKKESFDAAQDKESKGK